MTWWTNFEATEADALGGARRDWMNDLTAKLMGTVCETVLTESPSPKDEPAEDAPPPLPSARAYSCTNGCGASSENRVSRSGVQNRNSMLVANPSMPVAMAL